MNNVALYPGSFDPITNGHIDVIQKALFSFERITLLVLNNASKKHMFDLDSRKELIEDALKNNGLQYRVSIVTYSGLISELIEQHNKLGNVVIIRGLRNTTDFDYEMSYEQFTNNWGASTVYFTPSHQNIFISSSLVRNLILSKGQYKQYVPWNL